MTPDLAANLVPALDPDVAGRALAAIWPGDWGPAPRRLSVARVHFSRKRPPVVQYRADGAGRIILAEIVGAAAREHAAAETARIARRGGAGRVLAAAAIGLTFRPPGVDAKLPGLALLQDPGRLAALLAARLGADAWDQPPTVRLRAHRLARRAVLEITPAGGGPPVFARLAPRSGDRGLGAFALHRRIAAALRGAPALTIPAPLFHDAGLAMAVYGALPGRPLDLAAPGAAGNVARAMDGLADLRALGPRDVAAHDVARELALLAEWGARIDRHFPALAGLRAAAQDRVAERLALAAAVPAAPCHRDFHEGQVLIDGGRAGLLDFDTYRLGDPALDSGNLIAHIRLAELRAGRPAPGLIEAVTAGSDRQARDRTDAWARAALLRLGCIYAFTTEDARHAPHLMRAARDGLAARSGDGGDRG